MKIKYEYYSNGKIKHSESWHKERDAASQNSLLCTDYIYNDKGLVCEEINWDRDEYRIRPDGRKYNTTYAYKFDNKGNWIEKACVDKYTGYIEARTITYRD